MTDYPAKPKKAVWVGPTRRTVNGQPQWHWNGAPDTGIRHVYRLEGPVEQVVWDCWLEGVLLASTTLVHRGRSEAEHFVAWTRFLGLDAIGANRLLLAHGYTPSQHLDMEACNCTDCTKKKATV